MSLAIVRKLLEMQLNTLAPSMPTAWQNVPFTPKPGTPWLRVNLLVARTENPTFGDAFKRENGILQVTVNGKENEGPQASEAKAEAVRALFPRGLLLIEGKVSVLIDEAPYISTGFTEGGFYRVPVSVPWIADIFP